MTDTTAIKCSVKEFREFFESNGGRKVTMTELKEIKASEGGSDYDAIAFGIGNGSLTY